SQAAVFAADPPATRRIVLAVSVSGRIGQDGITMVSSMTSPTTRMPPARAAALMCGCRSKRGPRRGCSSGCGPGRGDLARDTHVVAGQIEVDLEAAALGELDDA